MTDQISLFPDLPPPVRKGIGGSEVAAIFGLSPYLTPLGLWERKTGREPPQVINKAQRRGVRLEGMVRRIFESRSGQRVSDGRRGKHARWKQGIRLWAATDGTLEDGGIFEAKTTALGGKKHALFASDAVPTSYALQLQQYAAVLEVEGGVICCLAGPFGDDRWSEADCELYTVPWRRSAVIGALLEDVVKAWFKRYIFSDTPPSYEMHPRTEELVRLLVEEPWLGVEA